MSGGFKTMGSMEWQLASNDNIVGMKGYLHYTSFVIIPQVGRQW
jgi:hypothetical protein